MRIPVLALSLATLFAVPVPASAQQMIAQYYASLSPTDMVNSNGQRLRDICQVLQQDRANYHRFGRRDDGDQWDPVFSSRQARAVISSSCQMAPGNDYLAEFIRSGRSRYVYVEVYGVGSAPSYVIVHEGAG